MAQAVDAAWAKNGDELSNLWTSSVSMFADAQRYAEHIGGNHPGEPGLSPAKQAALRDALGIPGTQPAASIARAATSTDSLPMLTEISGSFFATRFVDQTHRMSSSARSRQQQGSGNRPGDDFEFGKNDIQFTPGGQKPATSKISTPDSKVTRFQILAALKREINIEPILAADPSAKVGFRGSLARGVKGDHKGRQMFNTSDFDVDAFIVSDVLAANVPSWVVFRDASYAGFDFLQKDIDRRLRGLREFRGMRRKTFTFRIYTHVEVDRLIQNNDAQIYFTNSNQ